MPYLRGGCLHFLSKYDIIEKIHGKETNNLKTSDFYYDLPQELIAQTPLQQRACRAQRALSQR